MSVERKRVFGELGTVYAKCGGIFGISSFADHCMDRWMADPTLNANEAVATWHEKAQRCGFKFLVVQILGQLTGGPQRYTGRPMDEAHKHLNISSAEWDQFMEILNDVCREFQLPDDLVGDLNALMISMEFDCVVQDGERAPPNPGPSRPRGNSLYARCGGVYPIALFVDRLVDALIQDERVHIPCDGQKRNEASLKYLFTELICSAFGGPEIVTAKNFEETMLMLPKAAWEIFIATAQIAADHFPATVRAEVLNCLQHSKTLIVDPKDDGTALPQVVLGRSGAQASANVKTLAYAASGKMLSSAAIAARHAAPGAHVDARRRVMGDPRTLYGRGGGVFGLAKLSDRLMDAWMSNPELNSNAAVAKWHESQQKFGFKFLVTQLLGYLTGGPQRYTGVPMEAAHKHLAITDAQWNSFIADASCVFHNMGVEVGTQSELQAILASFKNQCVLQHGEAASEDPGKCRARPSGTMAYSHLGGVYPIALFADRLVDEVLKDDRVQVQWNHVDDTQGTRHPPGLKYMVTELLCHSAGGPELPTSKGFDEAKLGINPQDWQAFLGIVVQTTAVVWPTRHHRELMFKIVEKSKVELCFGLEGEEMPELDLPIASVTTESVAPCPFSGHSGEKCPFSGGQVPGTRSPLRSCDQVHVQANTTIGNVSGGARAPMFGRILGNPLQQKLDSLTEEDPDLCCPVSLMVFTKPVIASDGFIYDEASLKELLKNRQVSPMTREILKPSYRLASGKIAEVTGFRKQRSQELLDFAAEAHNAQEQQLSITALDRTCEYIQGLDNASAQTLYRRAVDLYSKLGRNAPTVLQSEGANTNESEISILSVLHRFFH